MSEDEAMIMVFCAIAGAGVAIGTRASSMPPLFTQRNPFIGMMRAAVLLNVLYTAYVIQFHGDPSIKGIYVIFYLVMAYAVTKVFGQVCGAFFFGLRIRTDLYERRNPAIAAFLFGFTLATGIVFGSSIWGEADPLTDYEGGWWIPMGFFVMGWILLVIVTSLYLWREPGVFRQQMRQERDTGMAWSVALFMLISASIIHEGVSGDFWGWRHGFLGMGTIALMLVGHEAILLFSGGGAAHRLPTAGHRMLERLLYIGLGLVVWLLNRLLDAAYTGG